MFSGGDYEEVARWLSNFARSHAKREHPRVEAVVDQVGAREGKSYGVRLRLGERLVPAPDEAPLELAFTEVAAGRGSLAWCQSLAEKVRALARVAGAAEGQERRSA
jgi:hypothetical protein